MPRDKDKDPWSRSFVSPTPSPTSFSDTDDAVPQNGFIILSRDNDLANELDLSRREDRAVIKETPFTLAKLRAQHKAAKGNDAREKDGTRMGGSIRTADSTDDPPSSSAKARGTASTSAPKKRRVANTGWMNRDGEPLPAGPMTKSGKRGISEQVPGPSSKPARKVATTGADQPPAKCARKTKKKKADTDKVEFRRLPAVTPDSNFPIVAALDRQRSLPPKKKAAKKADPPTPRRGPSKPRQTKLDIEALVGGVAYKPKAKQLLRSPDSDSSEPADLATALGRASGSAWKVLPSSAQTKPFTTVTTYPRHLSSPAEVEVGELESVPQFVDLTSPEPPGNVGTSPQAASQEHEQAAATPKHVTLFRPVPQRANAVQRLETLAAEHEFMIATASKAPRRLRPERAGQTAQGTIHEFQAPINDFEFAPPPPNGHGYSKFNTSQHLGSMEEDGHHSLTVPHHARPGVTMEAEDHSVQHGVGHAIDGWQSAFDEQGMEWDTEQDYSFGTRQGNEQVAYGRHDQNSGHSVYGDSEPTRSHPFDGRGLESHNFYSSNRAPSRRYSPVSDPRYPITPTSAYTDSRRRERQPLKGSWHEVLRSPSPAGPSEWSTLPQKRRSRITIRPEAALPKSSRNFRLPVNLFSKPEPSHPSQPSRRAPSPQSEPPLFSGPVKITKWTPTALRQPAVSRSDAEGRGGYVLPNLRALDQAAESTSSHDDYYVPQRSSHPAHKPRAGHSAEPHTQPYATPRSLAPPALSQRGSENDDDDWASAWRLSANRTNRVGTSSGY